MLAGSRGGCATLDIPSRTVLPHEEPLTTNFPGALDSCSTLVISCLRDLLLVRVTLGSSFGSALSSVAKRTHVVTDRAYPEATEAPSTLTRPAPEFIPEGRDVTPYGYCCCVRHKGRRHEYGLG